MNNTTKNLDEKIKANSFYEPYDSGIFYNFSKEVADEITKEGKQIIDKWLKISKK